MPVAGGSTSSQVYQYLCALIIFQMIAGSKLQTGETRMPIIDYCAIYILSLTYPNPSNAIYQPRVHRGSPWVLKTRNNGTCQTRPRHHGNFCILQLRPQSCDDNQYIQLLSATASDLASLIKSTMYIIMSKKNDKYFPLSKAGFNWKPSTGR